MTAKQESYIALLSGKLGYGFYASCGIKKILGKNPIGGVNCAKASLIIDELKKRLEARA